MIHLEWEIKVMDINSIIEHQSKELLKRMVDDTQGYTEQIRYDLKGIIDASQSLEELAQAWLLYFATINLY